MAARRIAASKLRCTRAEDSAAAAANHSSSRVSGTGNPAQHQRVRQDSCTGSSCKIKQDAFCLASTYLTHRANTVNLPSRCCFWQLSRFRSFGGQQHLGRGADLCNRGVQSLLHGRDWVCCFRPTPSRTEGTGSSPKTHSRWPLRPTPQTLSRPGTGPQGGCGDAAAIRLRCAAELLWVVSLCYLPIEEVDRCLYS